MNWYKHSMPTIAEIAPVIDGVCAEIKAIAGVKDVYLWGSYIEHLNKPNYAVKDVDIIASTVFDVGDLLAIDNSKYSALRIHPNELEDEGFNPQAVKFTKNFLAYSKYNVDHWVAASNKLLHWGAIPETQEEWAELHGEAEKRACDNTGIKRSELHKSKTACRQEWKEIYDQYVSMFLTNKATGWCQASSDFNEMLPKIIKVK